MPTAPQEGQPDQEKNDNTTTNNLEFYTYIGEACVMTDKKIEVGFQIQFKKDGTLLGEQRDLQTNTLHLWKGKWKEDGKVQIEIDGQAYIGQLSQNPANMKQNWDIKACGKVNPKFEIIGQTKQYDDFADLFQESEINQRVKEQQAVQKEVQAKPQVQLQKLDHTYSCLYLDGVFKVSVSPTNASYVRVSKAGWSKGFRECVAKVSEKDARVIYYDSIYTLNLDDGTYRQLRKANWESDHPKCVLEHKGFIYVISNSGIWKTNPDNGNFENCKAGTWKDALAATKIGNKGYVIYLDSVYMLDMDNNCKYTQLKKGNWQGITSCVNYNGYIYAFGPKLWRVDPNTGDWSQVGTGGWGGSIATINFGKDAYVHYEKAIYWCNLDTGDWKEINSESWKGTMALL